MGFFLSLVIGAALGISLVIAAMALTGGFAPRGRLPHPDNVEDFIRQKANF